MMTGAVVAVILMSLIGAREDLRAIRPRESRKFRRHADQAIDLTGGQR